VSEPGRRTPVELVRWAFGDVEIGTETDMRALFEDPGATARLERAVAPDAPVEFTTPEGGLMGDMAGPWLGFEGLRDAWTEWTAPWESWIFRTTDVLDVGGGVVLLLGDSLGRPRGSGVELETHAAALFDVSGDRIVRIRHFLDQDQARRAAGLS
jgi:ketosteroid isomerase-like protein